MTTTLFTSMRNTMKRDDSSGSTRLAAPVTSAYGGAIYVTNLVVAHNLGYIPQFRYYYEPFGDGVIWPDLASRVSGTAFNPLDSSNTGPGLVAWADSTNLYLQLFYSTNALTGTYPVYWVIYRDFAL